MLSCTLHGSKHGHKYVCIHGLNMDGNISVTSGLHMDVDMNGNWCNNWCICGFKHDDDHGCNYCCKHVYKDM